MNKHYPMVASAVLPAASIFTFFMVKDKISLGKALHQRFSILYDKSLRIRETLIDCKEGYLDSNNVRQINNISMTLIDLDYLLMSENDYFNGKFIRLGVSTKKIKSMIEECDCFIEDCNSALFDLLEIK